MKATFHRLVLAVVIATSTSSCMTAYDAYGRPQEVVDPGAALVGAAAVGLLAYGLSESNHHHYRDNYRYRDNGYYAHSYYRPSYRGYSNYGRGYCGY
jgi:hypothetical protein